MIHMTKLIFAPRYMEVDAETVKTNRLGKNARLEARVTVEQKQLLERAAGLRGQNLTEFMISVLADAATQTILDSELIALTERDRQAFAAALLNPTTPSEQAISDAKWYVQVNKK
jgi:uncharacterized protein (DUF1778 family)